MSYKILFKQCGSDHYTKGRTRTIDHIVEHYTGTSASAKNNATYFARNENQGASAHYFVDDISDEIYQSVKDADTAWHAGDWDMNCRAIGIEIVSSGENFSAEEIAKAAWLTQKLQKKYGIPDSNVIRHYDVTGKQCPKPYVSASKWSALKKQLVGGEASSGSSSESKPSTPAQTSGGKVTVKYALRRLNGAWLSEVTDFNNSNSEGYAGIPNGKHDYLYIKVDRGSVKYRVHTQEDGWLPWVTKGDKSDLVNGCAGVGGHAIDGVQIYYTTPAGETYQQAWYRSQTVARAGWLGVCCDDGKSVDGYDGWAGIYGEALDRLQIKIGSSNPF